MHYHYYCHYEYCKYYGICCSTRYRLSVYYMLVSLQLYSMLYMILYRVSEISCVNHALTPPNEVLQTSYYSHLLYEFVLQPVFGKGMGMNVTAPERGASRHGKWSRLCVLCVYLFICLSLPPSLSLYLCFICLFVYLYISLSLPLSLSIYIYT